MVLADSVVIHYGLSEPRIVIAENITRYQTLPDWLKSWLSRHQHPASQVLHAVGIPMLVVAGILIIVQLVDGAWSLWWRPVLLIVVSYFLQWIGHRVEGNHMGEGILIRKLLGLPYVAISPRYQKALADRASTA